jgi:site-specific recombinase XerD
MSGATFRTLLLFLYGTGMRLGEALRLRLMDVDLRVSLVTIRGTKFYKSRLVPLGRDVRGGGLVATDVHHRYGSCSVRSSLSSYRQLVQNPRFDLRAGLDKCLGLLSLVENSF